MAAECGNIEWQAKIKVPAPKNSFKEGLFKKGDIIETTAGTLAFNEAMPDEVDYVNEQLGEKQLKKMIETVYHNQGAWLTIQMLEASAPSLTLRSCPLLNLIKRMILLAPGLTV